MAVAIQSTSTFSNSSAQFLDLAKPSGLAVGDLMVAFLGSDLGDPDTQPGFTQQLVVANSGIINIKFYWKIATQDDVNETQFRWSFSPGNPLWGIMYRIDGHDATNPFSDYDGVDIDNTANPVFTAPLSPTANNIFLMCVGETNQGASAQIENYAMVTDNPTWTEQYETTPSSIFASASAPRVAATSTGNFSCSNTNGDTSNAWVGVLVAVQPVQTSIKTVDGLAYASVKTVNGLARASVKTIMGLQ